MVNFFKPTRNNNSTGQVITVTIEKLDHNGTGVGRFKNKPVFIENTLPQEKISAKIIDAKGKFFKATIIDISNVSKQRIEPLCKHFKACGGCDLQHLFFGEHLTFKQKKLLDLFSRNNIHVKLPWQNSITSDAWHYRRKARIGVQYNKYGEPVVGFRKKSSNQLTELKTCIVLAEPLKTIFIELKHIIKSLSLAKSIGHVEIIYTQHISIIIRQLIPLNNHDKSLWQAAAKSNRWQIYLDDGTNVSELTQVTPLFYCIGEELNKSIDDTKQANDHRLINTKQDLALIQTHSPQTNKNDIKPINIYFEPKDFIQVNHRVNNKMIAQAMRWLNLQPCDFVLDLFCGLGNFSLPIAQRVKHVVGIEGLQTMVDKAMYNANINFITNTEFFQADLNSNWRNNTWAGYKYTKALLDPARAGAYEAISQLITLDIPLIVYVSCDPATLAKDSQLLIQHGYTLDKIALIDMFAQTKHIETMVLFKK